MSHIIDVPIQYDQSYRIMVGIDLWDRIRDFARSSFSNRLAFAVIDENVDRLYGKMVRDRLGSIFSSLYTFRVPEGEESKNLHLWNKIGDFLLKKSVERETPLFAIGGGVTGDLAGFAASTTLRGIPLIHLPTTLLAMVDSSIGGKTGVNHETGKNLVGTFYQPRAVFSDLTFLETLDHEEWINGISEILKYGAIRNPEIFNTVYNMTDPEKLKPGENWAKLIHMSAGIKVSVVSEDTLEGGTRAFLNFGHTFAHALEKCAGYGNISHGEAVFVGMVTATWVSSKLGRNVDYMRFDPFKSLYNINPQNITPGVEDLVEAMYKDKKVKNQQIRLVLLDNWGEPCIEKCNDRHLLRGAWQFAFDYFD